MKIIKNLLKIGMLLLSVSNFAQDNSNITLNANSVNAFTQINNETKQAWTLAPEAKPDVLEVQCAKDKKTKVTFFTDQGQASFEISPNQIINFDIILNKKVICATQIKGIERINFNFKVSELPNTPENYVSDFLEVASNVNTKYTHLKNKKIDGLLLQSKYLKLVKNAKNNIEYGKILLRYFSELKNGHTNIFFDPYYIDCGAKLVENKVFLRYVDDKLFTEQGCAIKDEITKINNIPVLDYLQEMQQYISSSTKLHGQNSAVRKLFISYFEEDRIYTIKTKTGEKNIKVHFEDKPVSDATENVPTTFKEVESKIINNTIGYIAINAMENNVVTDFITAYEKLSSMPYLIIDIRKNGGGNSGFSESMLAYLIKKEQKACVSRTLIKPSKNYYKGKLFVLTGVYTFSAAESFAIDLLENNDAVFVGMPTGGDTGNQPALYTSKFGYSYRFPSRSIAQVSFKNFPMEGKGIPPNYTVQTTISDYLKEEDTVLKYTLNLIEKRNKK